MEEANKIKGFFRAIRRNMPKLENEKKIVDRKEFKEDWGDGLVGWNSNDKILEEHVGGYHELGNRELEERQVNNDPSESQLGKPHSKLSQRNERYCRERTKKIIEQEMTGARSEIPNGELVNVTDMQKER